LARKLAGHDWRGEPPTMAPGPPAGSLAWGRIQWKQPSRGRRWEGESAKVTGWRYLYQRQPLARWQSIIIERDRFKVSLIDASASGEMRGGGPVQYRLGVAFCLRATRSTQGPVHRPSWALPSGRARRARSPKDIRLAGLGLEREPNTELARSAGFAAAAAAATVPPLAR